MTSKKMLYRTKIEVWSTYDTDHLELEEIAREATSGNAFCAIQISEPVLDPRQYPDTEFFDEDEDN